MGRGQESQLTLQSLSAPERATRFVRRDEAKIRGAGGCASSPTSNSPSERAILVRLCCWAPRTRLIRLARPMAGTAMRSVDSAGDGRSDASRPPGRTGMA